MADPYYRSDINGIVDHLRRAHGDGAFDVAVNTVKQHLESAAWKQCALWLQVVNRLTQPAH